MTVHNSPWQSVISTAMQRPGCNPEWSGSYEVDGVDYDVDRDLHVTLYDSTPEGPVPIGIHLQCSSHAP